MADAGVVGNKSRAPVVIAISPNSTDIMEEQAEQVERLEMLLIEFEKKVEELGGTGKAV